METFNWTAFSQKIAIKATMEQLYKAWTLPKEIETWFLSKALFTRPSGVSVGHNEAIQTNDTYHWSWYLYDVVETGTVLEANGKDSLKFTFAGDCVVHVQLRQVHDHIVVNLSQSNIPTDNQSKRGIRLGCASGWSFFLLNLKSVYEGGLDLRNKDPQFQGMINN